MIRQGLWMFATLVLFGCAGSQGLHTDRLQTLLQEEDARFIGPAPPTTVAVPDAKRPTAPTLGLYLKPTGFLHHEFEWTDRDRETVLLWAHNLPIKAGGTGANLVPHSSLKGHILSELRASAARRNLDWLLVFDGAAAVDRYNNYKAPLLYWTILGAYLADGTHSDALCLLTARLWDVKTGALLLEDRVEGQLRTVGPAAYINDRNVIERTQDQALDRLLQRLSDRFASLLGAGR